MTLTRRQFNAVLGGAIGTAALPIASASAQNISETDMLLALADGPAAAYNTAHDTIRTDRRLDLAAGVIMASRFSRGREADFNKTLREITGDTRADTWFDWMLWQQRNPQIVPHQKSLVELKRNVYLRIDPNFDVFLKPRHLNRKRMRIRLEEVTWGGVRKDGIPSLDNPSLVTAKQASYMRNNDLVFGVSINGDTRAYPLRIMGWHEMFNEVIGGVPVALAYCTLCGSGILFETKVRGRSRPLVFGSSGFLYRSNKLMFDRATHSLWNQFTGKPVSGRLVGSGIELQQRPVVITRWKDWRDLNPDTKILSLQTGHRRNYGSGVVYRDYFSSNDLMFPALVDQRKHRQKDYVFGIREFGGAKAWPLSAFTNRRVINDGMSGKPLVLLGNAVKREVRAYERASLKFKRTQSGLVSNDGRSWRLTEDALIANDGTQLPRVAGHIAYWFAWNGYLGSRSELYSG
ncbi:MAG: DUF3179 domain-containing protein [Pseudomonadota bacterium]